MIAARLEVSSHLRTLRVTIAAAVDDIHETRTLHLTLFLNGIKHHGPQSVWSGALVLPLGLSRATQSLISKQGLDSESICPALS